MADSLIYRIITAQRLALPLVGARCVGRQIHRTLKPNEMFDHPHSCLSADGY